MDQPSERPRPGLGEIARLFLKIGLLGFGGPAAHIAMMEDEVVVRRGWLTPDHFLDLIGATNLIPGPNSTEMTMHVGYEARGGLGLILAGCCFILPAALLTGGVAWFYERYGALPEVAPFITGIAPAVIAVILGALWRLGKSALKSWTLVPVAVGVTVALILGVNEILALVGGGITGMCWLIGYARLRRGPSLQASLLFPFFLIPSAFLPTRLLPVVQAHDVPSWKLGLFFLKIGSILYGSGYVLVAFLESYLVQDYAWLTEQQLLDAIALGQFTPGPVLTTATFIGYVLGGWQGAVLSTLGIFLPSFLFVALLNPLIPRLRRSRWTAAFLDAVNVSAVALMLVVTITLGWSILTSWQTALIFLMAAVAVLHFRLNAAYLVLGGALLGWLFSVL